MRYTICYHGDIKVSYSSGILWLTVRRILTLCAVHVECILYTRPCEHYIATLQYHYTDNMIECETLNDDYMRLFMSGSVLTHM